MLKSAIKVILKYTVVTQNQCAVYVVPPAVSQYEYAVQFSGSSVGSEAHVGRGVHSVKLI